MNLVYKFKSWLMKRKGKKAKINALLHLGKKLEKDGAVKFRYGHGFGVGASVTAYCYIDLPAGYSNPHAIVEGHNYEDPKKIAREYKSTIKAD